MRIFKARLHREDPGAWAIQRKGRSITYPRLWPKQLWWWIRRQVDLEMELWRW